MNEQTPEKFIVPKVVSKEAYCDLLDAYEGLAKQFEAAWQMVEPLDDAIRDIMDICHGWTRKLSDDEKLTFITQIATKAVESSL